MFQLSAQLQGHQQDVKSLAAFEDTLVSVSRDKHACIWLKHTLKHAYSGQAGFVNSVAFLPPDSEYPQGLVVTGSADKTIHVFEPHAQEPIFILMGHSDNVCALDVSVHRDIVSGSWDGTAKIWQKGTCIQTLQGHTHAVWDVLCMDHKYILTASADKSIKLWNEHGKNVQTYLGHKDVVRSLDRLPGIGFVSASNDATLRIWSLSGDCLQELVGHDSFIYSVSVLPSGEIVSSGEDRCVKVWQGATCIQSISQPCTSLWCVLGLHNGDIAVGGSDGLVRVFTRALERRAAPEMIAHFEEAIAAQAIPSQVFSFLSNAFRNQVGDLDPSKLARPDALLIPGDKEGQVKLVKGDSGVEAYQWNGANKEWQKIGQVVDAVGQSRKQVYEGREYDFVFDIDIAEGMPPLKLPYNVTENPFQTAQDFIHKHELPQDYLDQIANFIHQNTKGVSIGTEAYPSQSDPFTGEGRYVPGGTVPVKKLRVLPVKNYNIFKSGNMKAILNKLEENNQGAKQESASLCLSENELVFVRSLIQALEQEKCPSLSSSQKETLLRVAFQWPDALRFPGIDILCSVALYASGLDGADMKSMLFRTTLSSSMTKTDQINAMLEFRLLSNMLAQDRNAQYFESNVDWIGSLLQTAHQAPQNKNLRVAIATSFLNLSVRLTSKTRHSQNVDSILEFLISDTELESKSRALAALGTLLCTTAPTPSQKTKISELLGKQSDLVARDNRIQEIFQDIKTIVA